MSGEGSALEENTLEDVADNHQDQPEEVAERVKRVLVRPSARDTVLFHIFISLIALFFAVISDEFRVNSASADNFANSTLGTWLANQFSALKN